MSSGSLTQNAKKKRDSAQRAEIIERLYQLAKELGGPVPLVERNLNGHQFKVGLCVGKSGSFYNIGRYYQVCVLPLHVLSGPRRGSQGNTCRKPKFITPRLPDHHLALLEALRLEYDALGKKFNSEKYPSRPFSEITYNAPAHDNQNTLRTSSGPVLRQNGSGSNLGKRRRSESPAKGSNKRRKMSNVGDSKYNPIDLTLLPDEGGPSTSLVRGRRNRSFPDIVFLGPVIDLTKD